MFYFGEIDLNKTIKNKRLAFLTSTYKWNKLYVHATLWLPFLVLFLTSLIVEGEIFYFSFLFAIWAGFSSYIKEKESDLLLIKTNFSKEENQKHIRQLIEQEPLFELKKATPDIYYCESNHGIGIWDKIVIIFFVKDIVYFAVLGNNKKLRAGKFNSKRLIKKDLESALNKLPITQV